MTTEFPAWMGDPSEFANHLREYAMKREERRERIFSWIESLPAEQLANLYDIVTSIVEADEPKVSAAAMAGHCVSLFRIVHETCVCGRSHDKDLLQQERDKMAAEGKLILPQPGQSMEDLIAAETARARETPGDKLNQLITDAPPLEQSEAEGKQPSIFVDFGRLVAEELANHLIWGNLHLAKKVDATQKVRDMAKDIVEEKLVRYGIEPTTDDNSTVRCVECKQVFVNIATRMNWEPNDCPGCDRNVPA